MKQRIPRRTILLAAITFIPALLSGCVTLGGGKKKKGFNGPWGAHAQNAWNKHEARMESRGVDVREPG